MKTELKLLIKLTDHDASMKIFIHYRLDSSGIFLWRITRDFGNCSIKLAISS